MESQKKVMYISKAIKMQKKLMNKIRIAEKNVCHTDDR